MTLLRQLKSIIGALLTPAVLVLVFFNTIGPDHTFPLGDAIATSMLALVLITSGLIVHELGHAGAVLVRGKTLKSISILRYRCDVHGGSARFYRIRSGDPPAGEVSYDGLEPTRRGVRDMLLIVAAGPIVEALFGVLLILGAGMVHGWLHTALMVGGCWSLWSALRNSWPSKSELLRSDGAKLLSMGRSRDHAIDVIAANDWNKAIDGSATPGAWPEQVVESMIVCLMRPHRRASWQVDSALIAGASLYYHFADRGDWVEANRAISHAFEHALSDRRRVNQDLRAVVIALQALHLALRNRNGTAASTVLRQLPSESSITGTSLYIGAQAATALDEGAREAAIGLASEALALLEPVTDRNRLTQLEETWWKEVIARATASNSSGSTKPAPPHLAPTLRPVVSVAARLDNLFAWDPGVPSDLRTVWIWRANVATKLELSA